MQTIQMVIIGSVVGMLLFTVAYYIYGYFASKENTGDEICEDGYIEDHVLPISDHNTCFDLIDNIPIELNPKLHFITDIAFDNLVNNAIISDIRSNELMKDATLYVPNQKHVWQIIKSIDNLDRYKNIKSVKAIKVVVELINEHGIVNQLQIENILTYLQQFAAKYAGHIRHSEYELDINELSQQLKHIERSNGIFSLYVVTQSPLTHEEINSILSKYCAEQNGYFHYLDNNKQSMFIVADKQGGPIHNGHSYNMLLMTSNLYLHSNPMLLLDAMLDLGEHFMHQANARLLTANGEVFDQATFNSLNRHVVKHIKHKDIHNINLGREIIQRIYAIPTLN